MTWVNLQVGSWWPLILVAATIAVLKGTRRRAGVSSFPNLRLVSTTAAPGSWPERLPIFIGFFLLASLVIALMDISQYRGVTTSRTARDYLVLVDTSRSMRQNTALLRSEHALTYPRKVGPFAGEVKDPSSIPEIARYELARSSLLKFLESREPGDRVGLVYFNSSTSVMSGFAGNPDSLSSQLSAMDNYVTGGTNMRSALEQGIRLIERYPGRDRTAVILLTDAEARTAGFLQDQLDRLRDLDASFYLLWITAETGRQISAPTRELLRTARAVGRVYTVDDLGDGFLDAALDDIAGLESYAYPEQRFERVDISGQFLNLAKWLALPWALMLGTLYLPAAPLRVAQRHSTLKD